MITCVFIVRWPCPASALTHYVSTHREKEGERERKSKTSMYPCTQTHQASKIQNLICTHTYAHTMAITIYIVSVPPTDCWILSTKTQIDHIHQWCGPCCFNGHSELIIVCEGAEDTAGEERLVSVRENTSCKKVHVTKEHV